MSRATDIPEQDVGGNDGDGLPTYEYLEQAHGPNSRCVNLITSCGVLSTFPVPQVRQMEELDRKKVIPTAHVYQDNVLNSGLELLSGTRISLRKN
jgi:hypothetical protein